MIYRAPKYAKAFHCIAEQCRDSCCIGWEIAVDEKSLKRYQNMRGALGEAIRESLTEDGCFRLCEGGRCPHLLENGLCRMICEAGEEVLCDICREHPRFYNDLGEVCEWGVGLSCESAAKLILESEESHALLCEERKEEAKKAQADSALISLLYLEREAIWKLIFDKDFSFEEKLILVEKHAETLQDFIDFSDISKEKFAFEYQKASNEPFITENRMKEYKELLLSLEPMCKDWPARCEAIKTPKALLNSAPLFERILSYFIYRYFITAAEDGDVLGKAKLSLFSTLMIYALCESEGRADAQEIAEAAKDFSKEVEYSEENTAVLLDAFSAFG